MASLKDYTKSIRTIFTILVIYAVLVATHLGEFWPFSIYPMFSQAGHPWKRAIILDVTKVPADSLWNNTNKNELPGTTVSLDNLNINANDIANYVSKTEVWTPQRVRGIRGLVVKELTDKNLMIYQAEGSLLQDNKVKVEIIPFIYLTADTTILNKQLKTK